MDPTLAPVETAVESAPVSRFWEILPTANFLEQFFTLDTAIKIVRVGIVLVLSMIFVGLIVTVIKKTVLKRMDSRTGGLIVKVMQYLGIAFVVINTLDAAQFDLSALLGAAGIAGIALGFAAQTSVSNFISGFFIVSEKTFAQGDVITVDGTTGIVYSIDALSVKLRTFDNQLIRIPNETLIKSNVANITRFPVRRLNIDLLVTYDMDIERLREVLMDVADKTRNALKNPEPLFMVKNFGESGIALFFGVWFATDEWFDGNNEMHASIQKRFEAEGIAFAYPTMTIYQKK